MTNVLRVVHKLRQMSKKETVNVEKFTTSQVLEIIVHFQEMYPNDKDFGAEVRNLIRVNDYLITKIKDIPLD